MMKRWFDDIQGLPLDEMIRLACKWHELQEAERIIAECEKDVAEISDSDAVEEEAFYAPKEWKYLLYL